MKNEKPIYSLSNDVVCFLDGLVWSRIHVLVQLRKNATGEQRRFLAELLRLSIKSFRQVEGYRRAKSQIPANRKSKS